MFQRMSLLWFYVAGWNKRQLVKFVLMKNNSLLLWDRHIFVPCCGGKVVMFSVFLRLLVNEVVFSLNRTAGFYWTEESLENCHREFTFNKISWRLLKCFCFFRYLGYSRTTILQFLDNVSLLKIPLCWIQKKPRDMLQWKVSAFALWSQLQLVGCCIAEKPNFDIWWF